MNSEVEKLVESLMLSIPGMTKKAKFTGEMAPKDILTFGKVIDAGLESEKVTGETKKEIEAFKTDLLDKTGLTEVAGMLKTIHAKS